MRGLHTVDLETLSPCELRLYLSLWAAERVENSVVIKPTFREFLFAATACRIVAEMQLEAIEASREFERVDWLKALVLINASIAFVERSAPAVELQQYFKQAATA